MRYIPEKAEKKKNIKKKPKTHEQIEAVTVVKWSHLLGRNRHPNTFQNFI